MDLELEIKRIIEEMIEQFNRPDLFQNPLVAFSDAGDVRYQELKTWFGLVVSVSVCARWRISSSIK